MRQTLFTRIDIDYNNWTEKQLVSLDHNDHEKVFNAYFKRNNSHIIDKQDFLFSWISPKKSDIILECGSSSGKTCIDLSKRSRCNILGIDFDPKAIEVSTKMRDKHFPELRGICHFKKDDLKTMIFDKRINKVIMPDFTEHIPDKTFEEILFNIKRQLPWVLLYIYTPSNDHLFDIIKRIPKIGLLFKKYLVKHSQEGHINIKNEKGLKKFIEKRGWHIIEQKWKTSHVFWFKPVEYFLGVFPIIGKFFHRRIVILAKSDGSNDDCIKFKKLFEEKEEKLKEVKGRVEK